LTDDFEPRASGFSAPAIASGYVETELAYSEGHIPLKASSASSVEAAATQFSNYVNGAEEYEDETSGKKKRSSIEANDLQENNQTGILQALYSQGGLSGAFSHDSIESDIGLKGVKDEHERNLIVHHAKSTASGALKALAVVRGGGVTSPPLPLSEDKGEQAVPHENKPGSSLKERKKEKKRKKESRKRKEMSTEDVVVVVDDVQETAPLSTLNLQFGRLSSFLSQLRLSDDVMQVPDPSKTCSINISRGSRGAFLLEPSYENEHLFVGGVREKGAIGTVDEVKHGKNDDDVLMEGSSDRMLPRRIGSLDDIQAGRRRKTSVRKSTLRRIIPLPYESAVPGVDASSAANNDRDEFASVVPTKIPHSSILISIMKKKATWAVHALVAVPSTTKLSVPRDVSLRNERSSFTSIRSEPLQPIGPARNYSSSIGRSGGGIGGSQSTPRVPQSTTPSNDVLGDLF
jgi:hypothetical protein